MFEARKENKVYQINDQQKDRYLNEGFDIYEDGQIIEYTPKKVIRYSDHLLMVKSATAEKDEEINVLKEQLAMLEEMKTATAENVLELLKDYAAAKAIDIGSSTSASGVLNKILEVEKE